MYLSGSGGPLYTPKTRQLLMETFSPTGLHVLVVDDDPLCLLVLEKMLEECNYRVTTCNQVNQALEILRERHKEFDLVISDVYMPDEDGFKLLEVIGLELDLPVIMISANADVNVVMKGILHGACDYLIKPVRIEELRNIWQHVIRRKGKDFSRAGPQGERNADLQGTSESREEVHRKRKDVLERPDDSVEDISSSPKRARVNWSQQLHQQFVTAVNQLGIDKAVPKRILQIMNVQGLSRESVASHLQKYRLYLKRLSGVVPEPFPVASFQASDDGTSGGSMLVRQGRKGSEPVANIKGLNLGAGLVPKSGKVKNLDSGTMKSLSQLKFAQQKQAANRAQVLSAIGVGASPCEPSSSQGGLFRMASLDVSTLSAASQDSSPGASSSIKIIDDFARCNISSMKLDEDIALPPPAPPLGGIVRTQSSMEGCITHFSTIAGGAKKQEGSRISHPGTAKGSVNIQGLVEEAMENQINRTLSSITQEGNVQYGLASGLFGSSDVPAIQADATWSSSSNYDPGMLQPIQRAATKIEMQADEAVDNTDISAKQGHDEPSAGSAATDMSTETYSDCSFEALIEDLGIIPESQQGISAQQQTNSELLDVDDYLRLD